MTTPIEKPKVKHGIYTDNPKCKFCGCTISHEWLQGDYTLLVCDSAVCLDKLRLTLTSNNPHKNLER